VIPDAQTVAQKWAARAGAAGPEYLRGAQQTDKDPTQLAIANQSRLVANFNARVQDGTWASRLRAVGKNGWIAAIESKGVSNYQTGVSNAQDKVAAAFGPLLAHEANLQRTVLAMPSSTDADREARMLAWVRGMRSYRAA
jgi:hypothetical protein